MRSDKQRLIDIQEAIIKIEKYTLKGKDMLMKDELIQTWMLYNLQIIGEAVRSISQNFKNCHENIQWNDISDFRNLLVHEYFRIDLEIVWQIIEQEIPELKIKIKLLLKEIQT